MIAIHLYFSRDLYAKLRPADDAKDTLVTLKWNALKNEKEWKKERKQKKKADHNGDRLVKRELVMESPKVIVLASKNGTLWNRYKINRKSSTASHVRLAWSKHTRRLVCEGEFA